MKAALLVIFIAMTVPCHAQGVTHMPAPIVFFDIAGADGKALRDFYAGIFGWDIKENNNFSVPVNSQMLMGAIRQDPPETLFYIGVSDITKTLGEIAGKGGSIEVPRLEVPGVVIVGIFRDPAGNRVGLVEMENGKAKIPQARDSKD